MLNKCVHYLSSDVCLCWNIRIMLNFFFFLFSNLLSRVIIFIELAHVVYVSRFRNVTLFLVREHSERRCSLFFAVHCGIFQGPNIPVHWKDFAIETALKMADSLASALTTEQGSWLRCTHSHMPRPFWRALASLPAIGCAALLPPLVYLQPLHKPMVEKRLRYRRKFPLASYDAVRSVVSIENWYFLLTYYRKK